MKSNLPSYKRKDRISSYMFLLPGYTFLLVATVFPLLYSLFLSFHKWNLTVPNSVPEFNGFSNYLTLLTDPRFLSSLRKTLIFSASAVTSEFALGLLLALIITSEIKGLTVLRTALLIPFMMTPVVAGVLWRFLLNPEYGVINFLISAIGGHKISWLAAPKSAFISILIVEVWQFTPVTTFILAAGISALPFDIYEAAYVDGANNFQTFKYLTLPLLKSVIMVVLMLRIIDTFRIFDLIYTLTYGGPGYSTELMSVFIYKQGLKFFQIGKSTAASWIFLIIVTCISFFLLRHIWGMKKERR